MILIVETLPSKTKSSNGSWCVYSKATDDFCKYFTHVIYFWSKKEALNFINNHIRLE